MTDTDPARPTPFAEWLAGHSNGRLADEAQMALAEAVQVTAERDADSTVTVVLKVSTAGSGKRSVFVTGQVLLKLPKPTPEPAYFWVGENGTLHDRDPYSPTFDAAPVPDPTAAPPKPLPADPGTGEVRRVPNPQE